MSFGLKYSLVLKSRVRKYLKFETFNTSKHLLKSFQLTVDCVLVRIHIVLIVSVNQVFKAVQALKSLTKVKFLATNQIMDYLLLKKFQIEKE